MVDQIDPAVVQIVTRGFTQDDSDATILRANRGSGSGVLVDATGYVVTNAHVVGGFRRIEVLLPQAADDRIRARSVIKPNGKLVSAEIVGLDRETDIAVLKIAGGNLPYLKFGDSEKLRQGHLVFAVGSPFGLENSVTMGIVSSVARQTRPDDPMIYIQTDASVNPGNSGGPLVDADGEIVGINTFIVSKSGGNEGIGFAVPSNIVKSVYEQIREFGRVRRGQIGIVVQTITPRLSEAMQLPRDWGVLVADVASGSAAAAAGIEVKDIVVSVNGRPMENGRQFGVNIYQNAGRTVKLELLRGGKPLTLDVAVLERPKDPDRVLAMATADSNLVAKLGILAVELDEKVTPMLPSLRRSAGVVVAGVVSDASTEDNRLHSGDVIYEVNNAGVRSLADLKRELEPMKHGQPVAVQIERAGQMQFILLEIN